jgi:hypothetical protein
MTVVSSSTVVYGDADRLLRKHSLQDILREHAAITGVVRMVVPISSADFSHLGDRGPRRMTVSVIALVGTDAIVFVQETMFGNLKARVIEFASTKQFGATLTNGAPYTIAFFAKNGYATAYLDHAEGAFALARALGVG